MSSLAKQSLNGVFWSAVEKFSLQGVQFIIGVILARLLTPSDFGMIGMLTIFLAVSQIFIDCGFTNALIRQKVVTERDYGTAFLLNALISMAAFAVLWMAAPLVASFYNLPDLKSVMRVVAFTLIINSLFAVHKAKLTRNVDFKTQSKCSLTAAILSGCIGIGLAYSGFGVWSLVYQNIANCLLNFLLMVVLLKWFPRPCFDKSSFHCMFGFGSKLLVASLIGAVYENLYTIVIGKKFTATNLGYFSRANQLGDFPSSNIAGILSRVTFPILSKLQGDSVKLNSVYEKYLKISCFAVFPLMLGLCALAKPTIVLLIGEKWLPAVLLLQILIIGKMWDPVCNINLNLLYVKGRSGLVLKLEILKKTIAVTILFASIPFGLVGMCIGRACYGFLAMFLNTLYTRQFIQLSSWKQIWLVLPYFLLSIVMGGIVYFVTLVIESLALQLILGILVGVFFYIGIAYALKMDACVDLIRIIKGRKSNA